MWLVATLGGHQGCLKDGVCVLDDGSCDAQRDIQRRPRMSDALHDSERDGASRSPMSRSTVIRHEKLIDIHVRSTLTVSGIRSANVSTKSIVLPCRSGE